MTEQQMQTGEVITLSGLEEYLSSIFDSRVEVKQMRNLMDLESKHTGNGNPSFLEYGTALLADIRIHNVPDQIVIHTMREDKLGQELRSDRAQRLLLDYDTFNNLPQHVTSLDIGAFTKTGGMVPLGQSGELFHVTRYAPGRPYTEDLKNLKQDENLLPEDQKRTLALAKYLVWIHSQISLETELYPRVIRDLFGHSEGIFSVIDSYPPDDPLAPPARLKAIEMRLLDWRWLIKEKANRLRQVHGDFQPHNILFQKDNRFTLLGRSRGEWGEPADDVSALSINYIFFALQQTGSFIGPFRVLFELFWEQYLQSSKDVEILAVVPPFFVWRALALAHPIRHPNLNQNLRQALFTFCENLLEQPIFDPKHVNNYLK
jgi:hypothetical protein